MTYSIYGLLLLIGGVCAFNRIGKLSMVRRGDLRMADTTHFDYLVSVVHPSSPGTRVCGNVF